MQSSETGLVSAGNFSAADENETPPSHRWTRAKLAKRAVIGIVLLATLIGGGAWMLHLGTQPVASRSFDALLARPIVVATRPSDVRRAVASEALVIVDRDTTRRMLSAPGGVWSAYGPQAANGAPPRMIATVAVPATLRIQRKEEPPGASRLYGTPGSTLDRIVAAGFSGVVLETAPADAALSDLTDLATRLSAAARHVHRLQPGFLVAVSGREDLIAHRHLVDAVDAFFKQRMLGNTDTNGAGAHHADYVASRHFLDRARRAGKAILVAVGEDNPARRDDIKRDLRALSYTPVSAPVQSVRHANGSAPTPGERTSEGMAADRMPFANF